MRSFETAHADAEMKYEEELKRLVDAHEQSLAEKLSDESRVLDLKFEAFENMSRRDTLELESACKRERGMHEEATERWTQERLQMLGTIDRVRDHEEEAASAFKSEIAEMKSAASCITEDQASKMRASESRITELEASLKEARRAGDRVHFELEELISNSSQEIREEQRKATETRKKAKKSAKLLLARNLSLESGSHGKSRGALVTPGAAAKRDDVCHGDERASYARMAVLLPRVIWAIKSFETLNIDSRARTRVAQRGSTAGVAQYKETGRDLEALKCGQGGGR